MKFKVVILSIVFTTFLSFSASAFVAPEIVGYKLNGKQESARLNPSRSDVVNIEASANVPVKWNTIALCSISDAVCNRTTAVKYFTQTDFTLLVSKEWDGKTSKEVIVADGDYKIKVTMKDESEQENIQELSPYIITLDSSFLGGSGGSSSSVSQSSTSGMQSGGQSFSSSASAGSGISSFVSAYSSSAQSISVAKYSNTLEINAGSDRLVYSDTPTDFIAKASVPKEFSEQSVKFIWSFGDGSSAEGGKVSHTYKFAGDYIVVLNASLYNLSAVSRAGMKVINPSVFISNIANDWVEITNQGAYEINLKGWFVSNNSGKFSFPTDTIIGPNKKISVPNEYMKLNLLQAGKVSLLNPSGKEVNIIYSAAGSGSPQASLLNTSSGSNLDNDPAVKKIREFIASGGKAPSGNGSSVSKNNLIAQVGKASDVGNVGGKSGLKNKEVSASENGGIFSSSTQAAAAASSQPPRRGFIRNFLNLPSSGFNLIKRMFYSEN
ncbi:MAG: transporter, substrate-binding protein [Parcubacteria group bacterium]|nr:transporter, substrate-binding protein [Parcubacteria group bacterium]